MSSSTATPSRESRTTSTGRISVCSGGFLIGPCDEDTDLCAKPPWFREGEYRKLLRWLYGLVPLLVVLGTYISLSFAFQADGWRTATMAAAIFGVS